MKRSIWLVFVASCAAAFGGETEAGLIRRLDELVQLRWQTPVPGALGMSRVAVPSSMEKHYRPQRSNERDFLAENAAESDAIAALEQIGIEAGMYVFGTAILKSRPQALDYRALKGPAALTRGTPRPGWYPEQGLTAAARPDALPDWNAAYTVAQRAMERFERGGRELETTLDGWELMARPVRGGHSCGTCHSAQLMGGVLYAFRKRGL